MEIKHPIYEIKLNSSFEDLVEFDELENNKIIIQQYEHEEDLIFISLNETMVKLNLKELKKVIDMLYSMKEDLK